MPKSAAQEKSTSAGLRAAREYKNYVNGEWVRSSAGKTFENRNPADREDLVGTFQESNADDLNAAVDAAKKKAAESKQASKTPIAANTVRAPKNKSH